MCSFDFFKSEIIGIANVTPMPRIIHYVIKENRTRVFLLIICNNQVTLLIGQRLLDLLVALAQIIIVWPGKLKQVGFRKLLRFAFYCSVRE